MNRRTFVLLGGTALLWPAARPRPLPLLQAGGRLRFGLDQRRRWSLWYQGADGLVPLIQDAELGAWIGDRLVTLADLEDITEGTRRPPGGEALVLRGRAAGVYLEAEFAWETGAAAAPRGAVTLRCYPDRELPTIRGVRFAHVPEAALLPGAPPLLAVAGGFQSGDPGRVERVRAGMPAVTSHALCGFTRGTRGLALAFDGGDPGDGRVRLEDGRIEAASDWRPARPLFPQGDAATLRLACDPAGDGRSALRALLTPGSPVDRERLATAVAPVGWSTRGELGRAVTEESLLANVDVCARSFGARDFRLIQLEDGYERAAGDWETNSRFPRGHRWLTDQIHAHGLQAGLWLAPFAVGERSGVPAAHPEWLLRRDRAPAALAQDDTWGGRVFALDGAHGGVQEWLFALGRRAVRDWGYDHVTVDLLDWACRGDAYAGGLTGAEALRRGLAAFREGLGADTFLTAGTAPLQQSAGLVNGMRIGPDEAATAGGLTATARAAGLRAFTHRTVWLNDPGCLMVRPPLRDTEARLWTSLVALTGGATVFGDDLTRLPPERLALLRRAIPATPVAGRPAGALDEDEEVAPAVMSGGTAHPIAGDWRFRTGDDAAYSAPGLDDAVWETIAVPGPWELAGRPDYDGFAWYRVRFTLPAGGAADSAWLELGKLDDADETFVNGKLVGRTGAFPPDAAGDRAAYRRYAIPAGTLVWGGENVLAIRVFDRGGTGGLWTTRRDRPADAWAAEGRRGWWTVALCNWDDAARTMSLAPAAAGIPGERFHAYDVWADRPLPDVTTKLEAEVAGRDVMVVSLRAAAARPQILATSRHLVQGAVDIMEETWDAATRTLSVRSGKLDARPYVVTIAVPRGLVAGACTADVPCTSRRLPGGQLVLEWPESATVSELAWSVRVRAAARPASR